MVLVLAIAGAACVLNGQPTPPNDAKGADASGNQDSGAPSPIQFDDASINNESTTSDASTDAFSDAFDPSRDASVDAQGDGG